MMVNIFLELSRAHHAIDCKTNRISGTNWDGLMKESEAKASIRTLLCQRLRKPEDPFCMLMIKTCSLTQKRNESSTQISSAPSPGLQLRSCGNFLNKFQRRYRIRASFPCPAELKLTAPAHKLLLNWLWSENLTLIRSIESTFKLIMLIEVKVIGSQSFKLSSRRLRFLTTNISRSWVSSFKLSSFEWSLIILWNFTILSAPHCASVNELQIFCWFFVRSSVLTFPCAFESSTTSSS